MSIWEDPIVSTEITKVGTKNATSGNSTSFSASDHRHILDRDTITRLVNRADFLPTGGGIGLQNIGGSGIGGSGDSVPDYKGSLQFLTTNDTFYWYNGGVWKPLITAIGNEFSGNFFVNGFVRTTGVSSGFFAQDRDTTVREAGLYMNSNIGFLYHSDYGNVMSFNSSGHSSFAGNVSIPGNGAGNVAFMLKGSTDGNHKIDTIVNQSGLPWCDGPRITGFNGWSFYSVEAASYRMGFRAQNATKYLWNQDYTLLGSTPNDAAATHALKVVGAANVTNGYLGRAAGGYGAFSVDNRAPALLSGAGSNWIHFDWNGGVFRMYVDSTQVKTFVIDHPDDEDKYLVHACAEGPTSDVFYRGEDQLVNGLCVITLPSYFESLTELEGRTVMVSPIIEHMTDPASVANVGTTKIVDGKFKVYMTNGSLNPTQRFFWRVDAVRKNTVFNVEPNKATTQVGGNGPYTYVIN